MTTSYKISDNLFLVQETLPAPKTKAVMPASTNHIVCVDCSGSMYYDLPKIRRQMKLKLPKLLGENDTISIVWFSGKGQFGTLLEGEKVAGLTDLQQVNGAIDRWLKPVGLTGFKEPMLEVKQLVDRVSKANPGAASLIFMTDGCDNQWPRSEIIEAVSQAAPVLSATTFVEYGYYADRPTLTSMAEKAGGQLIFSEDFDRYDAVFEEAVTRTVRGGKKIEYKLPNSDFVGGFAFTVGNNEVVTYAVPNGKVLVPEHTDQLFFLSPSSVGTLHDHEMKQVSKVCFETPASSNAISPSYFDAVYAAISLFATRMNPRVIRPLLKATGDAAFIEQFTNCFGKQAYSQFMDDTKAAAFRSDVRFTAGWDPNRVPKDDAFSVVEMLPLLAQDDSNKILFNNDKFSYSKIGRSTVDLNTVLTNDEHTELAKLTAELATAKTVAVGKKISAAISVITNKPEALAFLEDKDKATAGYSISNLTFNENRPNVSVLVTKEGTVDLSNRGEKPDTVPNVIKTKVFRNYSIIKDGLVNVSTLPMTLSTSTKKKLTKLVSKGLMAKDVVEYDGDVAYVHLHRLPVINAKLVGSVSATHLFKTQYKLLQAKGRQKVFNSFYKEQFPDEVRGDGWKETFGEEGVTWLKEQGLTEFSGFAPKSVRAEATDFYMGKELAVKLKGLSTLPTLKKVREGRDKGKLTASAKLMDPTVTEVEQLVKANKDDKALKTAITALKTEATKAARNLLFDVALLKFGVVVGQTWFDEFSSLDDTTLDIITDNGIEVTGTAVMKEIEIKI